MQLPNLLYRTLVEVLESLEFARRLVHGLCSRVAVLSYAPSDIAVTRLEFLSLVLKQFSVYTFSSVLLFFLVQQRFYVCVAELCRRSRRDLRFRHVTFVNEA